MSVSVGLCMSVWEKTIKLQFSDCHLLGHREWYLPVTLCLEKNIKLKQFVKVSASHLFGHREWSCGHFPTARDSHRQTWLSVPPARLPSRTFGLFLTLLSLFFHLNKSQIFVPPTCLPVLLGYFLHYGIFFFPPWLQFLFDQDESLICAGLVWGGCWQRVVMIRQL